MRGARLLAAAVLAIGLATARVAEANDPAAAQVLFDQGKKLMADGKWSEACPKLEESQRLDPAGGTLLHLALCREREGKIATAWAIYQDALSQAKRDARKDRAKIAQERIDALGPRLPRLRVAVARSNRAIRGFTITKDDVAVGQAQWGDPIPIDPGIHHLKAQAEGRKPWTSDVDVPVGAREIAVDVPELELDARDPKTTVAPTRIEEATRGDGQRTLAIATGAVGIVGLGLGTVFGIISKQKHDEADTECKAPDHKLCTPAGIDAGNSAQSAGTTATVALIVGGVLVAGGAALYFTAPSSGGVALAPTAAPGGGGLMIAGSFR